MTSLSPLVRCPFGYVVVQKMLSSEPTSFLSTAVSIPTQYLHNRSSDLRNMAFFLSLKKDFIKRSFAKTILEGFLNRVAVATLSTTSNVEQESVFFSFFYHIIIRVISSRCLWAFGEGKTTSGNFSK